jgi:hypothetical protein
MFGFDIDIELMQYHFFSIGYSVYSLLTDCLKP